MNGRRNILGIDVLAIDGETAKRRIFDAIAERRHERYAFLNAHGANLAQDDTGLRGLLASFTVLPDGAGVDIASRWLHGRTFPANLNGTDFVPALLADAPAGLTLGLWGAVPGVADDACRAFAAEYPHIDCRVVAHGFVGAAEIEGALEGLTAAPVDLLLVAMGNPRQETFIADRIDGSHASVVMGVGALLDFVAQRVPRAPLLLRRMRSEWVYRLALEPARMWRRYVIGNPLFLIRVGMQRLRNGRA